MPLCRVTIARERLPWAQEDHHTLDGLRAAYSVKPPFRQLLAFTPDCTKVGKGREIKLFLVADNLEFRIGESRGSAARHF
jgi:hypothetical protein